MTIPELYERVLWRDFSASVPQNSSWFERHREHIVEEVVTKHLETLPQNPRKGSAEKPIAVFVTGPVGSGKAVFAKRMLQAFIREGISEVAHIGTDLLRGAMLRDAATHQAFLMLDPVNNLINIDAHQARVAISEEAKMRRLNVVCESLDVQSSVVMDWKGVGYDILILIVDRVEQAPDFNLVFHNADGHEKPKLARNNSLGLLCPHRPQDATILNKMEEVRKELCEEEGVLFRRVTSREIQGEWEFEFQILADGSALASVLERMQSSHVCNASKN